MIGDTISHYHIVERLGGGGMGEVYEAIDTKLDRKVALKFLHPEASRHTSAKERFVREARSASVLDHPNICTVFEIDETDDGRLFIAMAHYGGGSLARKLEAGPLGVDESLSIAIQIAAGLARAHAKGIIHRDVKPANVMIADDGVVKIVDFGLAKLSGEDRITRTGATLGTLVYMSPEQVSGEDVDHRTDIWALGVVLFEMLTGGLPFEHDNLTATIHAILRRDPPPIDRLRRGLPESIETFIDRALQKDAAKRIQTMDEVIEELKSIQDVFTGNTTLMEAWHEDARSDRSRITFDSMAVLPLRNLSSNPDEEYFADGFTEAMITSLARLGSFKVVSRTSVMTFKASSAPLPEIAKALGVRGLIEGSVQREGDRIRVTAQLIDAATDDLVWVETYDREMTGVLALQSEIARSIAETIKATVGQEAAEPARIRPEAYEAYLKGREAQQSFEWEAGEYLREAIELEPDFAPAHAELASLYVLGAWNSFIRPREAFPAAARAARRAIELDPTLPEAHAALGKVQLYFEQDWARSQTSFLRAIDLNPSSVDAHQAYGMYLSASRRFLEGMRQFEIARELDPLSPMANWLIPWNHFLAEEFAESVEGFQDFLERFPRAIVAPRPFLAASYAALGQNEEALAECRTSLESLDDPNSVSLCGWVYGRLGRETEAREVLAQLLEMSEHRLVDPFIIGAVYLGLGDHESAMTWFERTYDERFPSALNLDGGPFGEIREHPRFRALIDRIGFPR